METMVTGLTPVGGALHRIEQAAADVTAKRLALELAFELRDGAVIEGVDLFGVSHRQAARAAKVTRGRIEAILVSGHPSRRRRAEVDPDDLPAPG